MRLILRKAMAPRSPVKFRLRVPVTLAGCYIISETGWCPPVLAHEDSRRIEHRYTVFWQQVYAAILGDHYDQE